MYRVRINMYENLNLRSIVVVANVCLSPTSGIDKELAAACARDVLEGVESLKHDPEPVFSFNSCFGMPPIKQALQGLAASIEPGSCDSSTL